MTEDQFRNEPAADFSRPADRDSMAVALAAVRASFGRTYPLFIDGRDEPGRPTAVSLNPARPAEVIGHACQATAEDIDSASSGVRIEQRERIGGYRWVDREKQVRAIPIERAMEIVVKEMAAEPAPEKP